MKKLLILITLITAAGCAAYVPLDKSPKVFTPAEVDSLRAILKSVTDTMQVVVPERYKKEAYANLPAETQIRAYNYLHEIGMPTRLDSAYIKGIRDAKEDLYNARLIQKVHGDAAFRDLNTSDVWFDTGIAYEYLLKNKYAIKVDYIGFCVLDESTQAYYEGYNLIFDPVIEKFYGSDFFPNAYKESKSVFKKEWKFHSAKSN